MHTHLLIGLLLLQGRYIDIIRCSDLGGGATFVLNNNIKMCFPSPVSGHKI